MNKLPAIVRKMSKKEQGLWKTLYKEFKDEQKRLQDIYGVKTTHKKYTSDYYFNTIAHNLACLVIWKLRDIK